MPARHDDTACVVLAGGLARRMGGGDKPLRLLGGRPLLDHVIARVAPQVATLLISANGDPARFSAQGLPVVPDSIPAHPGPLAGVLAGLDWIATHRPDLPWLLSVPGDAPFLPRDLARRLHAARQAEDTPLACARSAADGQSHPPIGLWPVALRENLRSALRAGVRRVEAWSTTQGCALAGWPADPVDPFVNVNTAEDLAVAERLLPLAG